MQEILIILFVTMVPIGSFSYIFYSLAKLQESKDKDSVE